MIVVYSGTRNLYNGMVTSVASLLEHNKPEKVYLMIEDDEFPYKLPECVYTINVSGLKDKYFKADSPNMTSPFTYMALLRACYVDIFKEEKILQLDVDTIVTDNLEPLWGINMLGKWFAACPEYLTSYNPFGNDRYYNIGVCLFNLEQMRKDNAMYYLLKLINTVKMNCVEQDALNFLGVPEKVKDIPVRYNESFCCGYTDHPAVVHYAGRRDWWTNPLLARHSYLEKYKDKTSNGTRI